MRIALLTCGALIVLSACQRNNPVKDIVPPEQQIVYPLSAPEKIVLLAEGKNDAVKLQLTNNLNQPIPVNSDRFAIILPGQKTLTKWDSARSQSLIPQQMLAPGQALSGGLQFGGVQDVVGARLVYNPRPVAEPVYSEIHPLSRTIFERPKDDIPATLPESNK